MNNNTQPITALPEGAYVTTDLGHRIHYLDYGQSSNETIVFLHGSGPGASAHSNFKGNYPALQRAGYRVVAIDHIGYGRSDKPTDTDYHLDFFVSSVMGVVDHLDIQSFALVGNSLGGAVAIKIALNHPERVTKLILMAPGGVEEKERYFTMPGIQAMAKFFTSLTESTPLDVAGLKTVLEELVYDNKYIDSELVEERAQVFRTQHAGVISTMQVPNMCSRLSEIKCPVLIFWGANERFMPLEGGLSLVGGCSDSRLIVQSKCGHWYMVEYANDFNRYCAEFISG